jgi:hypothetical protein
VLVAVLSVCSASRPSLPCISLRTIVSRKLQCPRLCLTIVSRAGAEYKLAKPKETALRVFQFFSSGESRAVNSCCSRISLLKATRVFP